MLMNPYVAAAVGAAIAGVSAVIAWLGLRWSAQRPGLLVAAVLGGTLVRLFLVAGVTGLLLALTEIHTTGYALGLILFYLLFLGVEIALVARSARGR